VESIAVKILEKLTGDQIFIVLMTVILCATVIYILNQKLPFVSNILKRFVKQNEDSTTNQ
jgi:hypothetical protein